MCRRCLFQIFGNVESYVCGHRHHGAIELSVAKIFTFDANILSKSWIGGYTVELFQALALGTRTADFVIRHCDIHITILRRGGSLREGDLRAFELAGATLPHLRPISSVELHLGCRYLNLSSTHSYHYPACYQLRWQDK